MAPPNYAKIFVCQISVDIIKHWHSELSRSKNGFFVAPFRGASGEVAQKVSGEKITLAAQQLYTKIRFPCFVV